MRPVIMVCGVQGSGKSWVCRQLTDKFHYVAHDRCWTHPDASPVDPGQDKDAKWGPKGSKSTHVEVVTATASQPGKPTVIITECPFKEREIIEQLNVNGVKVMPIFIIEPDHVLSRRYWMREQKELQHWVLSRARDLPARAASWGAFAGNSDQVLAYLQQFKIPAKYL